ncbi:transporter substrate-binding domain-containing protein [Microbacterium sp. 179-I 3D3 NHS]|uniref:transporter substrate-binding domain-containing protein n=1 Tax=Microbacterium sp. 179-I 3D3 NHS TaxID=3142382 RepID=UPI0039A06409
MHLSARRFRPLVRQAGLAVGVVAVIALTGCGVTVPADPDGTLQSVTGGELRVGTSADAGLVEVVDGEPRGSIVDLVDDFADSIDAQPTWTVASEETLVTRLEAGDLDLIAGGITADTPWLDRAGVSRGYTGIDGADGREIVMLVPLGENAFLSALESFLDREVAR